MEALNKEFADVNGGWVAKGGKWKPAECVARAKVGFKITSKLMRIA